MGGQNPRSPQARPLSRTKHEALLSPSYTARGVTGGRRGSSEPLSLAPSLLLSRSLARPPFLAGALCLSHARSHTKRGALRAGVEEDSPFPLSLYLYHSLSLTLSLSLSLSPFRALSHTKREALRAEEEAEHLRAEVRHVLLVQETNITQSKPDYKTVKSRCKTVKTTSKTVNATYKTVKSTYKTVKAMNRKRRSISARRSGMSSCLRREYKTVKARL